MKDEKSLKSFLEKFLAQLVERRKNSEEKCLQLESKLCEKQSELDYMQKNYDVQITKLTKIIKEKEIQYSKQKETMTSYYEQILNDVNSRVKVIHLLLFKP
jgi:hypothetical protein